MVFEMDYNQVLEHVQINNIVLAAAGDGVVSGLDVTEKGTPDMSVDVAAGSCKIGGTKYPESITVNLAISAADATHARKDLVIYDVATTNPLVITGSPATPPVPPDITAGDILLAIIDVAANETEITNSEITDCIVEITKLDELATPSDTTTLNASTAVHGLLKKLSNVSTEYMNGQGNWATPPAYSHPSARQCTTGTWAWAQVTGEPAYCTRWAAWTEVTSKPSTFAPSTHGSDHQSGGSDAIKLDDFATPDDNADLNASTSVHGLLKKLNNSSTQFMNGQGNWASPVGAGDMTKAVYDPNDDGVIALAQLDALVADTSGFTMGGNINMGDYQINGVDDVKSYDTNGIKILNSAGTEKLRIGATIYSLVANANFDMNSSRIESLADPSSAQDAATKAWVESTAGVAANDVFKIPNVSAGYIYQGNGSSYVLLAPSPTTGYQLTSLGTGSTIAWSAASDLIFSDTHCPKCGQEFQDGDDLILHVIGHNEVGDILTLPMHLSCANEPKKTVTLKRKVFEDRNILDEMTGELVVQRVQKTQKKTVTRHKLKEGYVINSITGKAHTVDDEGKHGEALSHLAAAIEEVEETIEEVVYEMVDFEL